MNRKISNKWFYLPVLILGIYLIIRIMDQSRLIYIFPLDFTNDISSYMARLFFLAKCGFHKFCPYWYNGFISFNGFTIGWSLFTLPLYLLTKDILIATFLSIILMYLIGFIFIRVICKNQNISLIKSIAFFLFFFANAITIGNFLRLGRTVSMFSFVLIIGLFGLVLNYKENKLDRKFFLLYIPLYVLILLSHQQEMLLSHFLILSLFLIKKGKERIDLIISSIVGLLISSIWLIPFISNSIKNEILSYNEGVWSLVFNGPLLLTNIVGIIIPLTLMVTFYLYWKTNKKSKKELLFYSPIIILNLLFLFRLTSFIPILKGISPDPYLTFFTLFIIFYFLKIKFKKRVIIKIIGILLIILSIINVIISNAHTPYFKEYGPLEKEVISIFPFITTKYIMVQTGNVTSYTKAYYSYSAIYYNITTAGGWYSILTSKDYLKEYSLIEDYYKKNNCKLFIEKLKKFNVSEVLFYGNNCEKINNCNLNEKKIINKVCLYEVS